MSVIFASACRCGGLTSSTSSVAITSLTCDGKPAALSRRCSFQKRCAESLAARDACCADALAVGASAAEGSAPSRGASRAFSSHALS